jgi:tetratricopeptide (TPR) repeat protein
MGDMLRVKGDNAGATDEYEKALSVRPDFIAARLGLARSLYSDHRGAEAEQHVKAVLEASPDNAEANYLEGELLVDQKAYRQALPFLLKALHVSNDELPYVHADLSAVYEDSGELVDAITEMKKAIVVDVDGGYYYRLGHLYIKEGHKTEAAEALQESERLRRKANAASQFRKDQ